MERIMRRRPAAWLLPLVFLLLRSLDFCSSLNDEGLALLRFKEGIEFDPEDALSDWTAGKSGNDPCSWRGIKCEDGKVSFLNLKDLRLRGTLAPELGQLSHLRYLILRNNCFRGVIPEDIGDLQSLEILDFSHNDLTGPVPSSLSNISSLQLLSIEGNPLLGNRRPELQNLCVLSDAKVNALPVLQEDASSSRRVDLESDRPAVDQLSLAQSTPTTPPSGTMPSNPPSDRNLPPTLEPPPPPPELSQPPPPPSSAPPSPPSPPPASTPPAILRSARKKSNKATTVGAVAVVVSVAVLVALGFFYYRSKKTTTIKPWETGLSGQLQKAFVAGVTQLRRSELEAACEGFSNIIGELSDCTLYKGTLSSGVEIAVASTLVNSAKDWTQVYEDQFRKKIATLSKVNHKNFSNLLGYCEENEPFTRMMVFEYAPNGTLHEHLHVREGEDLDWERRLRVIMGIAYCLGHVDQLASPIHLGNLMSESVYLTDDLSAKISDFEFWSETAEVAAEASAPPEIVNKFGSLLLEIIAGRPPVLAWAQDYLKGVKPSSELVDPNLKSFKEDEVAALCELVVRCCGSRQPSIGEINTRLREITGLAPDAVVPKVSPLWWAELEIASASDA